MSPPPTNPSRGVEPKLREDRRKQEEEKTRQEALRLELRRTEQQILAEALRGGVPPHMIPGLFANLTGRDKSSSESDHHNMSGRFLAQPSQRSFPGPPAATTPHPPMVLLPSQSSSSQHGIHTRQPPGNLEYPRCSVPGCTPATVVVPSARCSAPSPVPAPLPARPRPIDDEPRILPDIAGGHVPPLPPVQANLNPDPPKRELKFHHWAPRYSKPLLVQPNSRSCASSRKRKSQATSALTTTTSKRWKNLFTDRAWVDESSFAIGEPSQQQQRRDEGSPKSVAEKSLIGNRSLPEHIGSGFQVNRSDSNTKLESQARSPKKGSQGTPVSLYEPSDSDEESIWEAS
ncbi:hypothetical protein N7454_009913 [Penicillium verhagenii]|nr:hypothetical protein N7454_009913 [Penicillium verhagenii]